METPDVRGSRSSERAPETLALIEGAGNEGKYGAARGRGRAAKVRQEMEEAGDAGNVKSGELLLLSFFCRSFFMLLFSIVVIVPRAESSAVVVEVVVAFGDALAYAASLFAVYYVRGRDNEFRETIEFRTAVFSTMLMVAAGVKIGAMTFFQIRCADDNEYHFHHIPCAYLQARPNGKYVLGMEVLDLASYIPVMIIGWFYTRWEYYSPEANISHASAILHAFVDFTSIFIISTASISMIIFSKYSVYIDAVSSLMVFSLIIAATTHMWQNYFRSMTASQDNSPRGPGDDNL